ncbi:autotransporter outer membrane beta-barrel domain-containing protein [Bartonella alsatica]|uniref:Outer membrane autotransporter barrel domain-containing protein n=3 Tax=Bartonella TaxID=773 RepID=J0PU01_9HYPH|nr:autotransporter outer membrane beta-barrel domain-containing protein [Bartonella alsatica]EJF76001.1 outer membrane autotransporter barrel domain-containing protein [Bartonella alsatica IBS 382]QLC51757.1 autotransporter outer membrane beta-barrel domain-containing protein [Bartonella alsatica]
MINVFKKRTRLCALTTSAFFFLQGVDVCIGNNPSNGEGISQRDVTSCQVLDPATRVILGDVTPERQGPIECTSGGQSTISEYTIKDRNIRVTNPGMGLYAAGTSVKAQNVNIVGVPFIMGVPFTAGNDNLNGSRVTYLDFDNYNNSAVGADSGANIELKNSTIQSFFVGLVSAHGNIKMDGGSVRDSYGGVIASSGAAIFLKDVDIAVDAMGLYGLGNSAILMKDGSITLPKGGVGVILQGGATVALDGVDIRLKKEERGVDSDEGLTSLYYTIQMERGTLNSQPNVTRSVSGLQLSGKNILHGPENVLFIVFDGMLALNQQNIEVSDTGILWIHDAPVRNSRPAKLPPNSAGRLPRSERSLEASSERSLEAPHVNLIHGVEEAVFSHASTALHKAFSAHSYQFDVNDAKKLFFDTGINSSIIKTRGVTSYGVYFSGSNRFPKTPSKEPRLAFLRQSILDVPEGIGIYNRNLDSIVLIDDKSRFSGDLFLKVESSGRLAVFVNDSVIKGGAHIAKRANAAIYLSNSSEWHLTGRPQIWKQHLQRRNDNDSCVDSCISSLSLVDSTLRFIHSSSQDGANGYQTLRIGKGYGTVYSATGNSWIHLNARLSSNNSNDAQISDRLLIHGNVSGTTKVQVHDVLETGGSRPPQKNSISIIQVYGNAQKNSFQLNGEYVTLNGSPYQYTLHAYGPTIPPKMQYFDKALVNKSSQVWDFRLENVQIVPDITPYKSFANKVSPPEEKIIVEEFDGESDGFLGFTDEDLEVEEAAESQNHMPTRPSEFGRPDETSEETIVSTSLSSTPSTMFQHTAPKGRVLSAALVKSLTEESEVSSVSSGCYITKQNDTESLSSSYLCGDGESHVIKDHIFQLSDDVGHSVHANSENTIIELEGVNIISMGSSDNEDGSELSQLPISAVLAEENAEIILSEQSAIQSSQIGLEAQRGGKISMTGGEINADYVGVLVGPESSVNLGDTEISVEGPSAMAGLTSQGGKIAMNSGSINLTNGVAVRSELGGGIKLNEVNITAKSNQIPDSVEMPEYAAFLLSDGSSIDFAHGRVVTDGNALWFRDDTDANALSFRDDTDNDADDDVQINAQRRKRHTEALSSINRANIESSSITVEGNKFYGIYFEGSKQRELNVGDVSLKETDFNVPNSIAIYGYNSLGRITVEKKTVLSGDLLLVSRNNSDLSVLVNDSIITGRVRIDNDSDARFDLSNGSRWLLKRSEYVSQQLSNSCPDSCISSISLANSTIEFVSESDGYQTLHIGRGEGGIVYNASGNAWIYFNARLNPNDRDSSNDMNMKRVNQRLLMYEKQVSDRLIILGDVSGKTVVHVNAVSGNMEEDGYSETPHSVPIIKVYGKAEEDSFQLNGHYVTLENSPYKYTLRSYAPKELSEEESQDKEPWVFCLDNQYVESTDSAYTSTVLGRTPPGTLSFEDIFNSRQGIRSVVPQVPTYLLLPNSVFHAGLMDISNQNKQLELLRTISIGMVDIHKEPALYLRGYGSSYRYASDLSAFEYGYGGDLDYNAVEAGILLKTIENMYGTMSFGVMGTYGRLSLQPLDVKQSQESSFNKWTATAYGSMQYDAGFYVDGLLSYGLFKGDVLTLARGKTATLEGNPLSVSLTGGQAFATGYEGFVVDPQIQVVYQHLQFDKARDIDNFDIEMGKLDQWVGRIGGRLIKTPTGFDGVNAISFYGKLYLSHSFGEKQSVRFKDAFQLGSLGSSLEAGLGFNAKLSSKFTLYGDFLYQHKLRKAGFSGTSFSGGLRYRF